MRPTLHQLACGLIGNVTREDAQALAKLHGYTWKALQKALKRRKTRGR